MAFQLLEVQVKTNSILRPKPIQDKDRVELLFSSRIVDWLATVLAPPMPVKVRQRVRVTKPWRSSWRSWRPGKGCHAGAHAHLAISRREATITVPRHVASPTKGPEESEFIA